MTKRVQDGAREPVREDWGVFCTAECASASTCVWCRASTFCFALYFLSFFLPFFLFFICAYFYLFMYPVDSPSSSPSPAPRSFQTPPAFVGRRDGEWFTPILRFNNICFKWREKRTKTKRGSVTAEQLHDLKKEEKEENFGLKSRPCSSVTQTG